MAAINALANYGSSSDSESDGESNTLHLKPISTEPSTSSVSSAICVKAAPIVAVKVKSKRRYFIIAHFVCKQNLFLTIKPYKTSRYVLNSSE